MSSDKKHNANLEIAADKRIQRETQQLRTRQSKVTSFLVLPAAVLFFYVFYDDVSVVLLGGWLAVGVAASFLTFAVTRVVATRLDAEPQPTAERLDTFERWLLLAGVANSACFGSGLWWLGGSSNETLIYSLTWVSCIYAIGTMINISTQFWTFVPTVAANLVHPFLFHLGVGMGVWEPNLATSILVTYVLLLWFGRKNAEGIGRPLCQLT